MATTTPRQANGADAVVLVPCDDCGHMVPESNLSIHQAHACGGRARRRSEENGGLRQRRHAQPQQEAPVASHPSTPPRRPPQSVVTANNGNMDVEPSAPTQAATVTLDEEDSIQNAPTTPTNNDISSPGVVQVGDVVDLTQDTPPPSWSCPRCTLFHPQAEPFCNACRAPNPNVAVRPADATRRERLLVHGGNSNVLPSGAAGGALLGSVLGAANAYMGGGNVTSAAVEGAMTGFVGGAIVGDVLAGMNHAPPPRASTAQPNSNSVASARSGASMGLPTYPSVNTPPFTNSRRRMQPRQSVRVVRRPNGTTTVYTAGGGGPALSPEMMNLLLQSLMTTPVAAGNHHNTDDMSYEELLRAFGDGTEHLGADEQAIQSLPTATVKNAKKEIPADQLQCCICLEDFCQGQERKTLPCLHGFHQDCVDKWLRSNGSCPICKHKIS